MADDTQQIGITGESEPVYCGCGCGEEVRGRHSVSHSLGNGRYTLYLAKHDHIWNEDHPAQVDERPTFQKIVHVPVGSQTAQSPTSFSASGGVASVPPLAVTNETKKGKDQS